MLHDRSVKEFKEQLTLLKNELIKAPFLKKEEAATQLFDFMCNVIVHQQQRIIEIEEKIRRGYG